MAPSLHVPLTEQTRHLVRAETLARMKKGAILVNCARGGIVDEHAVADALAAGQLGGVALDVYEKEPPAPDQPLFRMDDVVCTPHIGASTEEAQSAVAVAIAEQLVAYLRDGVVQNAVNATVIGTYNVTYSATDLSGNEGTPATRSVRVQAREGTGGGGGGAFGLESLAWLALALLVRLRCRTRTA